MTFVTILTNEAGAVVLVRGGSVVVVVDDVVVVGLVLVVTLVCDGARGGPEWRSGVEPDDAVKVKTRIKRRMGLDHITQ
jgi:hypothetical protein